MPGLLQDWITEQADNRPGATAVVSDAGRLAYDELDAHSTKLAHLLKEAGSLESTKRTASTCRWIQRALQAG